MVVAALRYYRARQRAERTASLLAALTRATLAINAAGTFDGLARAAAAGAARIFAAQAIVMLEMPDGQVRRTSASPQHPEPVQRGGPAGLADKVVRVRARCGRGRTPPSWSRGRTGCAWSPTARCGAMSAWRRPGPSRTGRRWRWPSRRRAYLAGGAADPVSARPVRRAGRRGAALLRRGAPGRADPAAQPPAHGAARGTGPGHVVPRTSRPAIRPRSAVTSMRRSAGGTRSSSRSAMCRGIHCTRRR